MSNEEIVLAYQVAITDTDKAKALKDLTEANIKLLHYFANRLRGSLKNDCGDVITGVITYEDLIQEAWIALLGAAKSYKPDEGALFTTWVSHHIKNRIKRHIGNYTPKVNTISTNAPVEPDSDITYEDMIPDPEAEKKFWNYIHNKELRFELEQVISTHLTEQQQEVIKMFYGWNGYEYTFTHIADIYSCSRQNIRQIHNKALRQIRKSAWGQRMITEHEAESRSKKYNVRRGKAVDMAILDDYFKFAH